MLTPPAVCSNPHELFAVATVLLREQLEDQLIGEALFQNVDDYADQFYRDPEGSGGLPFEKIEVDIVKGEQKTPEFLALNPFGQVPVMMVSRSFLAPSIQAWGTLSSSSMPFISAGSSFSSRKTR